MSLPTPGIIVVAAALALANDPTVIGVVGSSCSDATVGGIQTITEAGLTASLTAVGVASSVAVPAVLVYRLVSTYLPPIWGYFCLRWLTKHDYL